MNEKRVKVAFACIMCCVDPLAGTCVDSGGFSHNKYMTGHAMSKNSIGKIANAHHDPLHHPLLCLST